MAEAASPQKGRLPRMRGDPPWSAEFDGGLPESTPHARGSTPRSRCQILRPAVYPACAGIHHLNMMGKTLQSRLPRMRGDPPLYKNFK